MKMNLVENYLKAKLKVKVHQKKEVIFVIF